MKLQSGAPTAPARMSGEPFLAGFSYGGLTKKIILYRGISVDEVQEVLRSAFNIEEDVTGFLDEKQTSVFPLSLVSDAPSYFAQRFSSGDILAIVVEGEEEGAVGAHMFFQLVLLRGTQWLEISISVVLVQPALVQNGS